MAYFNEVAGGPANAYRLVADSSLDWGQDLPALKEYMDAHGIARIKLSYFGNADPAYYGIQADRLPGYPWPLQVVEEVNPGDLVAVSVTNLYGVHMTDGRRLMSKLRAQQPVAQVGYSILIYRADFHWSGS